MRNRLFLTACLVSSLLSSAFSQSFTLRVPQAAGAVANAALAIDDSQPPRGEVLATAAAETAALDQADLLPAEEWELAEVAAALGADPLAAYRFVRDSIALDPYDGVLRGAAGTLAARSGSTWDRALLLQALLGAGGHTARLAYAGPESGGSSAAGQADYLSVPSPLAAPDPRTWTLDLERVRARATRDFAQVQLALTAAGVGVGQAGAPTAGAPTAASPTAAAPTAGAHFGSSAWVQVMQPDGSWLDLDPGLAEAGASASAATITADAVPDEFRHFVTLSVVAESLEGGVATSQVLFEQRLPADAAADQELWLYFQPDAAGVGGAVTDLFEGKSYLPVLMIDGATTTGTPFSLGGSGDDSFFGGFMGGGGPELIGLTLELAAGGPGIEPVTASRTLLDRAAAADREAGVFMTELLEPLPASGVPPALSALHHVMVSTGGSNPRDHAIARAFALNFAGNELVGGVAEGDYPLSDVLLPLAVADETLIVAAERGVVDGLRTDGVRAYVGHPRVYLSTLEPVAGQEGATAMTIDLALDGVSFVVTDTTVDASIWQQWYGALQSALETELTLARFRAVDASSGGIRSLSTAMSDATDAGQPLKVVEPSEVESVAVAAAALRSALRAGQLAVVVGDAARGGGFWSIDPTSGATRSIMEPGLRVGFTWGGNYTNSSPGGPRWVIDPKTGNTLGYERGGKFYRYGRPPPSRCSGGTEYVVLLGCVSIPAGMTLGLTYGVIVTAIVSWATAVIELVLLM